MNISATEEVHCSDDKQLKISASISADEVTNLVKCGHCGLTRLAVFALCC